MIILELLLGFVLLQACSGSKKSVSFKQEYYNRYFEVSNTAAADFLKNHATFDLFRIQDDGKPCNDQVLATLIETMDFRRIREIFAKADVFMNFSPLVLKALGNEAIEEAFFEEFPELYDVDYLFALAQNYESFSYLLLHQCIGNWQEFLFLKLSEIIANIPNDLHRLDFLWKLMISDDHDDRMKTKRITLCAREFITSFKYFEAKNDLSLQCFLEKASKQVLQTLFVQAIQLGSIEIVDAVLATTHVSIHDRFSHGIVTGNALMFINKDAKMLQKLVDVGADLGGIIVRPEHKNMTIVTWLLLQNDSEMNSSLYTLEFPSFRFDAFLREAFDHNLPELKKYVLAREPTLENVLKWMKPVQPLPRKTFYYLEAAKDDTLLQAHIEDFISRKLISERTDDYNIYLQAVINNNLFLLQTANEMEISIVIDGVLKGQLVRKLHVYGTEYFSQYLMADPRLLEFNFMVYLKRDSKTFAELFLIAPTTSLAHLNWISQAWKNRQIYLQFLYLVMEKYAVERGDEVVKAIANQYVSTLTGLNVTVVPRRVFLIQAAFKRAIIQVAQTEGFLKLSEALKKDLKPQLEDCNHCALSIRSIRNYFFSS